MAVKKRIRVDFIETSDLLKGQKCINPIALRGCFDQGTNLRLAKMPYLTDLIYQMGNVLRPFVPCTEETRLL